MFERLDDEASSNVQTLLADIEHGRGDVSMYQGPIDREPVRPKHDAENAPETEHEHNCEDDRTLYL